MSYTVDWVAKEVTIPTSDLTLVSGTRYSLDLPTFLAEIRRLEWEPTEGLWAPAIINHANTRFDFAGVNYAPFDEVLNGYTFQFSGVATRVDLLGSNNNLIDVLIITGVSVVPSNSAGLIGSKQLLDTSYSESVRVYIDVDSPNTGTTPPLGTPGFPVNNLADAQAIIDARTLPRRLFVKGALTIGASDNIDGYDILGAGAHGGSKLTLSAGCSTTETLIQECELTGTADGEIHISRNCFVHDLFAFEGTMQDSTWSDTIRLINSDAESRIGFFNNRSYVAGSDTPILDCNGVVGLSLNVRGHHGGLTVLNFDDASMTGSIDAVAIHLILDATCSLGDLNLKGLGLITNNSTGTVIDDKAFIQMNNIDGFSHEEAMRLVLSAVQGKLSGAVSGTIRIRDIADTKDRLVVINDVNGNRTNVVRDAS